MTLEEWKSLLEQAILVKLAEIDSTRTLKILDVGLFPWHASIELSAFYVGDDFEDDIASWPSYNFSHGEEGRWPEVEDLCKAMNTEYEASTMSAAMSAAMYFQAAASVMKRPAIAEALNAKRLDDDFRITVLDPDNPDTDYM